ncbi:MAG TPA: ribonuclease J [Patescibacteria group bacterium]|nr:ribonuclease J [Patescibacteria group bacterium]
MYSQVSTIPVDKTQTNQIETHSSKTLKIIPLGGFGEIGKNIMVIEYDQDILVIDCGMMFPHEEMLGIDFVIPDTRYLEANRNRIRGLILTHGHEDHIGAMPYLMDRLGCPVYGSALTIGLVKVKFEEFGVSAAKLNVIKPGDSLRLGNFQIDTFDMIHTMSGDLGLLIHTPVGRILHLADFRFDDSKVGSDESKARLAEIGKKGVFLLTMDSTNVEEEGKAISEEAVEESIGEIFKKTWGRIIVTSFASSIPRIQSVISACQKNHRRLFVAGRSMERNIEMTERLGYLSVPKNLIYSIKELKNTPDREAAILCTGSQGEEFSALTRVAAGTHHQIRVKAGDTVVVSGSVIPGNERPIANVVNKLFKLGAEVIYGGESAEIHTSGHAKRDDLKEVFRLTKPEYFVPMHGEFRHLVIHAKLALEMGVTPKNIFVMENGQVLEFSQNSAHLSRARIPSGYVLVDGLGVGDVGNIVLRDRQAMAKDGILVAIMTVDAKTGKLLTSPDIISRGFIYMREREDLVHQIRSEVKSLLAKYNEQNRGDWATIKTQIREDLGQFIYNETQRRPMILPVTIELNK